MSRPGRGQHVHQDLLKNTVRMFYAVFTLTCVPHCGDVGELVVVSGLD